MKVLIVDPPEGWRYGFPKVLDETQRFQKFLLNNGYPRHLLDLAEKYSRYWIEDDGRTEFTGQEGPEAGTSTEPHSERPQD